MQNRIGPLDSVKKTKDISEGRVLREKPSLNQKATKRHVIIGGDSAIVSKAIEWGTNKETIVGKDSTAELKTIFKRQIWYTTRHDRVLGKRQEEEEFER